jgi:hypothetical protein
MGISAIVEVTAILVFCTAICCGISALVPENASMTFNNLLAEMDGVYISGCDVQWFLESWRVCAVSCAGGRGCCFLFAIVHQQS